MAQKIFGRWSSYNDMIGDFHDYPGRDDRDRPPLDRQPTEEELLFASYGGGSYEGDAFVLFRKDGKLFEVNGSHCSCYGLEGQWGPEETSIEALASKGKKESISSYYFLSEHDGDSYVAYWNLIESLQRGE